MKTKEIFDKRSVHLYILIAVIVIALAIVGFLMLKYHVEGEKNLPFEIKQISVISTAKGGTTSKGEDELWHTNLSQQNDIYIQIEKNSNYKNEETIKRVTLENFAIIREGGLGEITIYRPSGQVDEYNYSKETAILDRIEYRGAQLTDTEILEINNQGGVIRI